MATDHSQQVGGNRRAKRAHVAMPQAEPRPAQTVIDVDRSGDWMPADELRAAALSALDAGSDVTLHLGQVDHPLLVGVSQPLSQHLGHGQSDPQGAGAGLGITHDNCDAHVVGAFRRVIV